MPIKQLLLRLILSILPSGAIISWVLGMVRCANEIDTTTFTQILVVALVTIMLFIAWLLLLKLIWSK